MSPDFEGQHGSAAQLLKAFNTPALHVLDELVELYLSGFEAYTVW